VQRAPGIPHALRGGRMFATTRALSARRERGRVGMADLACFARLLGRDEFGFCGKGLSSCPCPVSELRGPSEPAGHEFLQQGLR
jgi:hypothetical protein